MKHIKGIQKMILLLMLAVLALEGSTWSRAENAAMGVSGEVSLSEPAMQEDGGQVIMKAEASAANDSVLSHVFANMFNQAMTLQAAGDGIYDENGEWEDPSLQEYPLDPHELSEYGDSPRVRRITVEDDEGREILPAEGEGNFFVYRDTFLVIPEEEAADYTLEYTADRRSAVLSPMPPADDLEGKQGIVLLGRDISEDEILVYGGAPAEEGDSLILSLQDPDTLSLSRIFSDGSLSLSGQQREVSPGEDTEGVQGKEGGAGTLAEKEMDAPLLAASGTLGASSDYYDRAWSGYTKKEISGSSWSGAAYYRTSDLGFSITTDINVLKLRFNINLNLDTVTKFNITSTGSTNGKEQATIGTFRIDAIAVGIDVLYAMEVSFNEVPVQVAGTIRNAVTLTAGLHPLQVTSSNTVVNYDTIDIDEQYRNQEASFYVGNRFAFSANFLEVKISVGAFKISIGPVVSLTVAFGGGSYGKAIREMDRISQDIDRTAESIHACVINGRAGCLDATSENKGFYEVSLKVNLYVKKWNWKLASKDFDSGTIIYYNSYEENSGLQEGECPARLYRVPVKVYLKDDIGTRSPLPDAVITPRDSYSHNPEVVGLGRAVTDANGDAAVYLPAGYNVLHATVEKPEEMSYTSGGFTVLKKDNPTVIIELGQYQKATVQVQKVWNIDQELQDRPRSSQFVIERWDPETSAWVIARRKSDPDALALLTISNSDLNAWKQQTITGTFDDLPVSSVVSVQEGNVLTRRLYANRYRVRELDGIYVRGSSESLTDFEARIRAGIIADSGDTGLTGTGEPNLVTLRVPGYITLAGEKVPEHETRYMVEYAEKESTEPNTFVFAVTNTPVLEVDLYKRWVDIPADSRPNDVYLALLSAPKEGWLEQVSATGMVSGLIPASEVISGDTASLQKLIQDGIVAIDLPALPDQALAVTEVSAANQWHAHYVVPKYVQGIPMRYAAAELDADYLQSMMLQQTGLEVAAYAFHGLGYTSISGDAAAVESDWHLAATVLNMMEEGNIIGGVKYWRLTGDMTAADLPEQVTLTLTDGDGNQKQVTVSRPASVEYDYESTMWPWTLKLASGEDAGSWSVEAETLPESYSRKVVQRIEGNNVINTLVDNADALVRISKTWDPGYAPVSETIRVTISDGTNSEEVKLRRYADPAQDGLTALVDLEWLKPITLEKLQGLKIEEDSYNTVHYIFGPSLMMEDGVPVYTFNLVNLYSETDDHMYYVYKKWDLGGKTAEEIGITEDTEVSMYFLLNGDQRYNATRTQKVKDILSKEQRFSFGQLEVNGAAISSRDPMTGEKNLLTLEEEISGIKVLKEGELNENGGFRLKVTSVRNRTYEKDWYVTNVWEPVDVATTFIAKGTVRWEDENDGKGVRPESVRITLFNSRNERVKTMDVRAEDGWTWSVSGLPEKDADGKPLRYYIAEQQPQGYTRTYSPDYSSEDYDSKAYDAGTRTWTLDVSNALTGYYALNIVKELYSSDAKDRAYPYSFEINAYAEYAEYQSEILPYRATGTTGTRMIQTLKLSDQESAWTAGGEANVYTQSGQYEFLFDEEGVYLYILQELEGENPPADMTFDTTLRGLIITAVWNEEKEKLDFTVSCGVLAGFTDRSKLEDGSIDVFELSDRWVETDKVTFRNVKTGNTLMILKAWDIDQEGTDHPAEIPVVIQGKKAGETSWEEIREVTLKESDGWFLQEIVPKEYTLCRVLEKTAAGAAGSPVESGGKVIWTIPETARSGEASTATHETEYRVTYGDGMLQEGDVFYPIVNQAVETVTVKKEWIGFNEGDEKPDSVWLVLMGRALDGTEDDANAPHGSIITNPFSGGQTLDGLKKAMDGLQVGVDTSLLTGAEGITSVAIAQVSAGSSWQASFEVPKYQNGAKMEYWGAELDEALLRRLLRDVFQTRLEVSYLQKGSFLTLPGKALTSPDEWEIPDMDLAQLKKAAGDQFDTDLSALRTSWQTASAGLNLTDTRPAAVVFNVKVPEQEENTIRGAVIWRADEYANRPASVDIHIYANRDEIDGSPVKVVPPANDAESRIWTWSLTLGDDVSPNTEFTVSEEFPLEYAYEGNYLREYRGLDTINTWQENGPDQVIYKILKQWENPEGEKAESDADDTGTDAASLKPGDRPEVTVALYESGTDQKIGTYTLNAENDWTITVDAVDEGYTLNGLEPGDYYILETNTPQNMWATYLHPIVKEEKQTIPAREGESDADEQEITVRTITYPVSNWVDDTDTVEVTGRKSWVEFDGDEANRPDTVQVQLYVTKTREGSSGEGTAAPYAEDGQSHVVTISPAGAWEYFFANLPKTRTEGEGDSAVTWQLSYSVREVTPETKEGATTYTAIAQDGEITGKNHQKYKVKYDTPACDQVSDAWTANITNAQVKEEKEVKEITIQKKWDIDLENKDHPDTIEVVLQKAENDQWVTQGDVIRLSGNNEWTAKVKVEDAKAKYRVRELSGEKGILNQLKALAKEYTDGKVEEFKEYIDKIKEQTKSYYEKLPENVRGALDGSLDSLAEKLKDMTDEQYEKLWESISKATRDDRIVYDKSDAEGIASGLKQPSVTYHVNEYTSVLAGGSVPAHSTKYYVSYDQDGDTYTIKNLAVLDIDVIKRWVHLGNGDQEKPSSAWVVLMFRPKSGSLDKAADLAKAAGVDLSSLTDVQLPAFNLLDNSIFKCGLLEGGENPVSLFSKMTIGFNIDIFGLFNHLLKVAIVKVDESKDWTASFVHTKYMLGMPVEFEGDEVTSEIIRLLVKYIVHVDPHVSFNPFQGYVSIGTPALPTFKGFSMDSLNLSTLSSAAKNLLTSNWEGLVKDMADTALDQTHLAANVINIQISTEDDDGDPGTIRGEKIWVGDQEADRPETLTIRLWKGEKQIGSTVLKKSDFEGETNWGWKITLPEGEKKGTTYTVTEEYPAGYDAEKQAKYQTTISGYTIYNTWELVTVAGRKTWVDADDADGMRPEKLFIFLKKDGVRVKDSAGEDLYVATSDIGNWEYAFPAMAGKASQYTVEEKVGEEEITEVDGIIHKVVKNQRDVEGYVTTMDGWNITNTRGNVEGRKIWRDSNDNDRVRPESITVYLNAPGSPKLRTLTVTAPEGASGTVNEWPFAFTDAPKYDADGNEIEYYVTEDRVEHYISYYYGMTLVNAHSLYGEDIYVRKVWEDEDNRDGIRPDTYTVELYGNGKVVKTEEIAADAGLYHLGSVNQFEDGTEIIYELKEREIKDYTASYEFSLENARSIWTITNQHTPELTSISGTKTWDDQEDQYGTRSEQVTIRLMKDGAVCKTQTISAAGNWEYSFEDLPRYEKGKEISYTVEEDVPTHYTARYLKMRSGYDIRNTLETVTLTGVKTWADAEDQDGIRPGSITLQLHATANGSAVENLEGREVTISAADDWRYSFRDLPKYLGASDTLIQYSITEKKVPEGYLASYDPAPAFTDDTTTATQNVQNRHTPETTSVSGEKTWWDAENQDGKRPASITVLLLQEGTEIARKEVTPDSSGKWTYTFTELPKYAKGKEIQYTISEEPVPEYIQVTYEKTNLLNFRAPEMVNLKVTKQWDDGENQDGIRPETVEVALRGDGGLADTCTLSAENGWTYTWENLPMYQGGQAVSYLPRETELEGYTAEYLANGYDAETRTWSWTIINHHTPETTELSGQKVWWDLDDQDGLRPDTIRINLYADGLLAGSRNVTAEHGWKYTFTGLPKYRAGREISYTITESEIEGYLPVYTQNDVINVHIPGEVRVKVTKVWEDEDDVEGFRPDSVTVALYGNDTMLRSAELSAENDWSCLFDFLPERAAGEKIGYSVLEYAVEHYTTEYEVGELDEETMTWSWTVINRHAPEYITVSGEKTWQDEEDRFELRPKAITVSLMANDGAVEGRELTVTAEDGWRWSFDHVIRYRNGKEVEYTVAEEPVKWYVTEEAGMDLINTPTGAPYTVEFYYQQEGSYPSTPDSFERRIALIGEEVSVTEADRQQAAGRYSLDVTASNTFEGTVNADGTLALKLYFRPYYIITYDPNGGIIDGGTKPVSSQHWWGEEIRIHSAAVRSGYVFDYWSGSAYDPGDAYTVTEDHTFVARWKKENDQPKDYKFTFTKKWSGGHEDSISWTLYHADGTVAHKLFNKKEISEEEWKYEAWFDTGEEYYLMEDVPAGYSVRYENVGSHADVTDRCYNGGTIINSRSGVPRTGDSSNLLLWIGLVLAGMTGLGMILRTGGKRKKSR